MTKKAEYGQTWVEYGLIIGLIAVILLAIIIALGPQIKKMFSSQPTTQIEKTIGTQTETGPGE